MTTARRLVLLGGGHAHLAVLADMARSPWTGWDITLVSPLPHLMYSGMVPGLIAGHYRPEECRIALAPLAHAAGVRWRQARCTGIDAGRREVRLVDTPDTPDSAGATAQDALGYELLSIDTGGVMDADLLEARMPGASRHALAVRPIEGLVDGWARAVQRLQQHHPHGASVAVIGSGAAGIELVFAARQGLAQAGLAGVRLSLLTGEGPVAAGYPAGVRRRLQRQLQQQHVTVLPFPCTGVDDGAVHMGSAGSLVCQLALLATGSGAPAWLQGSGLALGPQGHVATNRFLQSTSHPDVLAAGDVADRADHRYPRSGVHAVRAGPPLAINLRRAATGQALQAYWPPQVTLNLLSCGTGHAVASWGPLSAAGAWVWRWKDRIDRAFVARHHRPQQPS